MKVRLVEKLSALGPIIEEICSATGAPSVAIGVSYRGEAIHQANFGFRNVEEQFPPDSDTLYGIGSITKVFTASAIGILVEEGSLNWTTPVHEILPGLQSTSDFITKEMTVVDVLSHSTGLATSTEWWYGSDGVLLLHKNQTLPYFNALKQVGSLRSRYDYNNWNYALLGEIIEKLSAQSYGSFIKEKILGPLGMDRTSVSHIFNSDDNLALPYAILEDLSPHKLPIPRSEDGKIMAPAQAIQSITNDLLKYTQGLLYGYHDQMKSGASSTPEMVLKHVVKQLGGHISRGAPSMLQKAYCLGLHRHQLPNAF